MVIIAAIISFIIGYSIGRGIKLRKRIRNIEAIYYLNRAKEILESEW